MKRRIRFVPLGSLIGLLFWSAPLPAQITWNITYSDPAGTGFNDPVEGQLRRDSILAATQYLNTVLDGRGTVNIEFRSAPSGATYLASFGPSQIVIHSNGSFQNGGVYQAARTNTRPFSGVDGSGDFNFSYGWNYVGQSPASNKYDMVSVAIHELLHGVGFLSLTDAQGRGLAGRTPPTPDIYAGYDRYLYRGSGSNATALFNTDINSSNYASFVGNPSVFTAGNDPNNGLFFIGPYSKEVYGGAVPLYAPNPYREGSSVSHVNINNAVMYYSTPPNTVKRLLNFEIAMLLDIGWNVYDWNNTTGNWLDGVSGSNLNVSDSRWRSTSGIVRLNGQWYNRYGFSNPAPVLPRYGQVTSNIVLNFGGSGSTGYTATNDIGSVRLARLNFNSSASAANTITGGSLLFGVNSDGSPSVLAPKIIQQGSGAFVIASDLVVTNTASSGGWTGLTVEGTGTGRVTLSGTISGTGDLTKQGNYILEISGNTANTFSGRTTVAGGTLLLNKTVGQNAIGGNLTIASGGTVLLAADHQLPNSGTVRLEGGTLRTGEGVGHSDILGALELASSSAIALASGQHSLTFTGISGTPSGNLTISGWSGDIFQPGTAGRIYFSNIGENPNQQYSGFLNAVRFAGFPSGGLFLSTTTAGVYELVPVPEPVGILATTAGLGLLIYGLRRWRKRPDQTPSSLAA
ncbi:MAG: hypothetical protein KatS3mg107_1193 [Gemmataceae bacterium]|jgi:autotransporter-associated beta strand protein|nr:MAG: hypothetical protein KatS3mg107_1193 [Gemmataceae bacterium]